jgi:DNA-binding transcriptional MerR regulator
MRNTEGYVEYVTAEMAAEMLGVDSARVRDWARRGLIVALNPPGTNYRLRLYAWPDVVRAERTTRTSTRGRRRSA